MKILLAFAWGASLVALSTNVPDSVLVDSVANRSQLIHVTPGAQQMQALVATLCAAPTLPSSHDRAFFDVYISSAGVPNILSGKGVYPVGTIVLKQKYSDQTAITTEIYTGMLKREKGFNPTSGDWEYFVVSGDGKTVSQRGAIQSCMACHAAYEKTDFVTRYYPLGNLASLHLQPKQQAAP